MMKIVIEVESTLEWTATQSPTNHKWVAECEPLGLSMEGDSLDELHGLIPEACFALFVDLFENSEIERFLRERGWQAANIKSG